MKTEVSLSKNQALRLGVLSHGLLEVTAHIADIAVHGYEGGRKENLEESLGYLMYAMQLLCSYDDLDGKEVGKAFERILSMAQKGNVVMEEHGSN